MKIRVLFLLLVFSLSSFIILIDGEEAKSNKFREREATDDNLGYPNFDEDDLLNKQCPQNLELRWQTEVSSSIYATPLIADINSDGKLDVVVPSFVHYLEVLEGSDGDKMPGWPAFHQSTVHASPLLYDIDKDGVREIALATYNGEVLFFRASGYIMSDKLVVPRLRAKRDWYVGLLPDPIDHSHPDVHDDQLIEEAAKHFISPPAEANNTYVVEEKANHTSGVEVKANHKSGLEENNEKESEMQPKPEPPKNTKNASLEEQVGNPQNESDSSNAQNKTSPDIALIKDIHNNSSSTAPDNVEGTNNETKSGRRLLEEKTPEDNDKKDVDIATLENEEGLETDADSSFELFRDNDGLADEYNYDYDDYVDETMWGDEEWTETQHEASQSYVHVDSHILCTPLSLTHPGT